MVATLKKLKGSLLGEHLLVSSQKLTNVFAIYNDCIYNNSNLKHFNKGITVKKYFRAAKKVGHTRLSAHLC